MALEDDVWDHGAGWPHFVESSNLTEHGRKPAQPAARTQEIRTVGTYACHVLDA